MTYNHKHKTGDTVVIVNDFTAHERPIGSHHLILDVDMGSKEMQYLITQPDDNDPFDIGIWIGETDCRLMTKPELIDAILLYMQTTAFCI